MTTERGNTMQTINRPKGKGKRPNNGHSEQEDNVLLRQRADRRLLPNVQDKRGGRAPKDRRGGVGKAPRHASISNSLPRHYGTRYLARLRVEVVCGSGLRKGSRFTLASEDVSTTGMLLRVRDDAQRRQMEQAKQLRLRFAITPGAMPEGYEGRVSARATVARMVQQGEDLWACGVQFTRPLTDLLYARRGRKLGLVGAVAAVLLTLLLMLMRVESVLYFQFNKLMYAYSIMTAGYLLTRYLFGALYKPVPIHPAYKPGVTIIIPCFNEEEWITRTIMSCVNQFYPPEKLEVIVVDDCSNDASFDRITGLMEELRQRGEDADVLRRLRAVRQERNQGKRVALVRGARMARHELVVFVDSDSFLDPYAIVNLVQPFRDPKMGGVTGRTDVANTYTNFVTKMQSVRYYISFRVMKAAEAYFDAVTCLSGPLSCYRKEIVLEHAEAWLNQSFLGMRATFGDDRAMTNFVLKKHRTSYQDSAVCSTIVPNTHRVFLKQQMRWKRSWLRETSIAAGFIWRKEPLMALSFYCGFIIPVLSPLIVLYNLVYTPLALGFFPRTFLIGLGVTALLMSATQLCLRKSSTWPYGAAFCLYYVLVLMWQMPAAWVTFWKSTWGTRLTPEDMIALGLDDPGTKGATSV